MEAAIHRILVATDLSEFSPILLKEAGTSPIQESGLGSMVLPEQ